MASERELELAELYEIAATSPYHGSADFKRLRELLSKYTNYSKLKSSRVKSAMLFMLEFGSRIDSKGKFILSKKARHEIVNKPLTLRHVAKYHQQIISLKTPEVESLLKTLNAVSAARKSRTNPVFNTGHVLLIKPGRKYRR